MSFLSDCALYKLSKATQAQAAIFTLGHLNKKIQNKVNK